MSEPPRREQKKAELRRRILESAREVFFRDGFIKANLDEVADSARVAKGTLYRYFDNKAELYVAVLARDGNLFAQKMRDSVDLPDVPPPQLIRQLAGFWFRHWMNNREYFQIFWALENQPVIGDLPDEVVDEVVRLWDECLRIVSEIVQRGVEEGYFRPCDPWEVADILWTLANGVIQTEWSPARRRLRKRPLEHTFTDAVEFFLGGLAPTAERG